MFSGIVSANHFFPLTLFFNFSYILFFNFSLHSVLLCITFRSPAQCLDSPILYRMVPQYFQYPPGTVHNHYNIIDYFSYAALCTPVSSESHIALSFPLEPVESCFISPSCFLTLLNLKQLSVCPVSEHPLAVEPQTSRNAQLPTVCVDHRWYAVEEHGRLFKSHFIFWISVVSS